MDSIKMNYFKDYCPKCNNFDSSLGVCATIHENVRNYPKKFVKECNGKFFKEDPNKIIEIDEEYDDDEGSILDDSISLVTVYIPKDEADHLAIGALLHSYGIEYYSKNSGVQNLFGIGQIGGGFNLAAGPVEIQVAENNYDQAIEIVNKELTTQKDNIDYKIPDICPACNSSTKGLPKCPDCGLGLIPGSDDEQSEESESDNIPVDIHEIVSGMVRKSLLFSIFWLFGVGSIFAVYYGWKSLEIINQVEEKIKGKVKATFGIIFGILGIVVCLPIWLGIIINC